MRRRLPAIGLGLVIAGLLVELLLGGPLRPELTDRRDAEWQAATRAMHVALHQPDPELIYAPRPGASVAMDYGEAAFNAQGLRESRDVSPRPGDRPRVIVLGDSLVWGELLAREQGLPAQLEARLEAEVLNLGVTGYDTVQEAAWYRRRGRALEPDLALLVFCLNDLLTMSGPFQVYADEGQRAAYAEERAWLEAAAPLRNESVSRLWFEARRGEGSQLLAALAHAWRWHRLFTLPGGYIDELLLSAREPARVARMRGAMSQLGADLEADGVQGVLLISPALYWWHDYKWGELHALAREAGEAAGFVVLDPITAWAGEDPTALRFPGDNLHYTPEGVARLADFSAPALGALAARQAAARSARPSSAPPSP
ncbi:MAG: hypothetical protein H6740_20590 [Alphaproteobacteria bacterium]|nr:hypothetical protein [Alphaproteobacteria bacterium]